MVWATAPTFTALTVPTAANLNALSGDLNILGNPWTTYTPAWTSAGTAPVLGNGTITGSYIAAGKLIIGKLTMVAGSTTTYGTTAYSWSLPFAAVGAGVGALLMIGNGSYQDSSASARFPRIVQLLTATTIQLVDMSDLAVGQATPAVWAVGDSISASFMYEAA